MTHIKDVMKKLMEAEKAKMRLIDMITNMQEETLKFYHGYLEKNREVSLTILESILCIENC